MTQCCWAIEKGKQQGSFIKETNWEPFQYSDSKALSCYISFLREWKMFFRLLYEEGNFVQNPLNLLKRSIFLEWNYLFNCPFPCCSCKYGSYLKWSFIFPCIVLSWANKERRHCFQQLLIRWCSVIWPAKIPALCIDLSIS